MDLLRGYLLYGHVQAAVTDWAVLLVSQVLAGRYYQKIMM